MYSSSQGYDPSGGSASSWTQQQMVQQTGSLVDNSGVNGGGGDGQDEDEVSRRPPNAFILFSQVMRSQVRTENPALSNTEVSRILGKMWKEVPNDQKIQYKQRAAQLQEEFKRTHPDYTYRKARRKRALNELLTKSANVPNQNDPYMLSMMNNPMMFQTQMIAAQNGAMYNPQQMYGYTTQYTGQSPMTGQLHGQMMGQIQGQIPGLMQGQIQGMM